MGKMKRNKADRVHPTKQALIDTVIGYIHEVGPTSFTVDEVLGTSGISKGSMYHHFEDFAHLIESAQAVIFASFVDEDIAVMGSLLDESTDFDSFIAGLLRVSAGIQSEARRARRLTRASILGAAGSSERLREALAIQQERLSTALSSLIVDARSRGWIRPDVNPDALALFVQAYSFGRVLNDVTAAPVSESAWNALVDSVVRHLFEQ
jgi:AcrR family transcriptional regulator